MSDTPTTCGGTRKKITRKGYTRKFHHRYAHARTGNIRLHRTSVKRTRVPRTRIHDQGAVGKWQVVNKSQGIEMNHPGSLSAVGYSVGLNPNGRHRTLRRAVHKYGPLSTFRKLNAVSTFTKRTSKGRSKKFHADASWVKHTYL